MANKFELFLQNSEESIKAKDDKIQHLYHIECDIMNLIEFCNILYTNCNRLFLAICHENDKIKTYKMRGSMI